VQSIVPTGKNAGFWHLRKNNIGSLPLCGILQVKKMFKTPYFRAYSRRT